ncbi:hypothetical protein D3C71_1104410 [compost metagenome]
MAHLGLCKALVHQVHHALVAGRADHAASGLHHLLQTGVEVGVVIARAKQRLHALADLLVDGVDLRQAEGGDEGAYQPLAGQVDALGKRAAQHSKGNALADVGEAGQKITLLAFEHAARLAPVRHIGVLLRKQRGGLLQVVIAAEKRQIVAGQRTELLRHQRRNRCQRRRAVRVACGDVARHLHLQLVRGKGRFHIHPHMVLR